MREIILPETKPALEWVGGRALQKVSPQHDHALAQGAFVSALLAWARGSGSGRVGTEWEFRLAPPGSLRRPLVPDVAFLSFERVAFEDARGASIPHVAPDAVVEVISPGDKRRDIDEKMSVYLACGTSVVFLVDTRSRTVISRDLNALCVFSESDVIRHVCLPGFALPARSMFEPPNPAQAP
jgi:Uma2 family endonuclease